MLVLSPILRNQLLRQFLQLFPATVTECLPSQLKPGYPRRQTASLRETNFDPPQEHIRRRERDTAAALTTVASDGPVKHWVGLIQLS